MKILFVENRHTTYLWDKVATGLIKANHEVFWIIQNPEFDPKNGSKFYLKNKRKKFNGVKVYDEGVNKIIRADRGLNHYGLKTDDHIFSFQSQISSIIEKIKPDVGFGESTLSHELLTAQILKDRNIPYFFPITCRFPVGRMAFYWYDTLVSFGGSGETIPYEAALKMVEDISTRLIKPVSIVNQIGDPATTKDKLFNKIKLTRGYIRGERFNTPGILKKIKLNKRSHFFKEEWDKLAVSNIRHIDGFKVLYPLQMQPESTIDTWATEFNDQAEIIRNLLTNSSDDINIIVKPNPSTSLEIDQKMLDLISSNPRVISLSHSVKMDEIINDVDLVVTTTGTIGLECIFSNKPVITLVNHLFNLAKNCLYLKSFSDLKDIIDQVKKGVFPVLSMDEKIAFINYLNETSYKGVAEGNITNNEEVYGKANVKLLLEAIESILKKLN